MDQRLVFVVVIAVFSVPVPIMDVIDMVTMLDGLVGTISGTMSVLSRSNEDGPSDGRPARYRAGRILAEALRS